MKSTSKKKPTLYLVVPCYNEEETIEKSADILLKRIKVLEKKNIISNLSKIMFVNDGSKDNTERLINNLIEKNKKFCIVSFTANSGHQNAIYAGMITAKDYADVVVTIDADLQQDINALERFITCYKKGADVVYGVRNDRNSDNATKKITAIIYYKIMKLMGCGILENSADYRLLSKKALNILANYKESGLFLRGLIPSMGLNSDIVYFDVKDRELGKSKYTLKKMIILAIDGITSSSAVPIHLIFILGCIVTMISILVFIFGLFVVYPDVKTISNIIFFALGICLISIGIVGEYLYKVLIESKQRPRYIVDYIRINK